MGKINLNYAIIHEWVGFIDLKLFNDDMINLKCYITLYFNLQDQTRP